MHLRADTAHRKTGVLGRRLLYLPVRLCLALSPSSARVMATTSKRALPLLLSSFLVLLTGSPCIHTAEAARPAKLRTVTAIYVFGDSTADVGNNNYLPGNRSKVNFLPYGVDFPGGYPTGRFSNGYNGVDYLAQMLGYEKSPPAVLSVQNSTRKLATGVSFASGGSGILDTTGANTSLSLNTQIELFENVSASLTKSLGAERAQILLSKALFIFSVGNNDMFGYNLTKFGPTNSTAKDQFIGRLATTYKAQLQKLYSLGARKFAVVGTTTLGCVPYIRAQNPTGGCIEDLNDLSLRYNNATAGLLKDLSVELEGMKYSFANAYRVLTDAFDKPLYYGYKELQSSCCGDGCTPNSSYCGDRNQYLFWDAVHPTQKTYKLVAINAFKGSQLYTVPMNIQQLAKL